LSGDFQARFVAASVTAMRRLVCLASVVRAPLASILGSTIRVVRALHRREEPPVHAESILAVTAATWGIAMGLSPALQIRQMLQTRSSRDVSVGYFTVLNVGFVLWASYGISMPNVAVAVPNFVAFGVGSATIAVALRLRADERRRGASARVNPPGSPQVSAGHSSTIATEESLERQIDHSQS
jgi:uncharacterized protein with PQ loop repeat